MLFIKIVLVLCTIPLISGEWFGKVSKFALKYTSCKWGECCQEEYIKNQVPDFHRVFGQHLATAELKNILSGFYKSSNRAKPLVISLHGTPGTGKNFVADQIVSARYALGKKSEYIHGYSGRINFPMDNLAPQYSADLLKEILKSIDSCPYQTFVFDEVDKMPRGVFESIVGILDDNTFLKADMGKSIFIFISNLGGVELSKKLHLLMRKEGLTREDTVLRHFESVLEESAYNDEGGLQRSRSIEKAVIDYFIPFLPLEQRHVEMCISRLIAQITNRPQPKVLQKILKSVAFEQETNMFAASGCKKLEARVHAELHTEL